MAGRAAARHSRARRERRALHRSGGPATVRFQTQRGARSLSAEIVGETYMKAKDLVKKRRLALSEPRRGPERGLVDEPAGRARVCLPRLPPDDGIFSTLCGGCTVVLKMAVLKIISCAPPTPARQRSAAPRLDQRGGLAGGHKHPPVGWGQTCRASNNARRGGVGAAQRRGVAVARRGVARRRRYLSRLLPGPGLARGLERRLAPQPRLAPRLARGESSNAFSAAIHLNALNTSN